jgi:type II secretory pathway predicted ATPase ExeA
MSEFIEVGGFDDEAQHRAESLRLPALPGLSVTARVRDAFDTAAVTRRGVAIIGPKGAGKSSAITQVLREFLDREHTKWQSDRKYVRQGILRVRGLRAKTYRDGVIAMFKALTGAAVNTRARGRSKTDDELLDEFVFTLMQHHAAVIIVDEAEYISAAMFEILRDIMSEAADRDPRVRDADADGYAAVGVGILLSGTSVVSARLAKHGELRERWARTVEVNYVPASEVPDVFVFWFPAFAAHVGAAGKQVWEAFIRAKVTRGQPMSLRLLDTHARFYFRRVTRRTNAQYDREHIPFIEQHFLLALQEAQCQTISTSGGDDAAA